MVIFTLRSLYPIMYIWWSWIAVSSLPVNLRTLVSNLSIWFYSNNRTFYLLLQIRVAALHSNVKAHSLCQALLLVEVYLWQPNLCKNFLAVYPALQPPLPPKTCKELYWLRIHIIVFLTSKHRCILRGLSPDILIQNGTKHQLSVYDKMQMLFI